MIELLEYGFKNFQTQYVKQNNSMDDKLKEILTMCQEVHEYFEEHFYDCYSAEKAHYHLHLAQEAINEYKLDKEEGLI